MRYRKVFISALGIGALFVSLCQCKKSDKGGKITTDSTSIINSAGCSNIVLLPTADSTFFTLPTAFTPNEDGRNDIYRPLLQYPNKISNFRLSIYKKDGTLVYQTDSVTGSWDGTINGKIGTDYKYQVNVSFTGAAGMHIDTCTYLFLLAPDTTTGCNIYVDSDMKKYMFADQFDAATGYFSYPTSERFCK